MGVYILLGGIALVVSAFGIIDWLGERQDRRASRHGGSR
jgi:hypothetical protein